jgi:predicted aldo/keto reductase-like oxidoreductase
MQYRPFGKTNLKVSALGFGCMRLPLKSEDSADIDEVEATRMVRHAIDNGVNYIDTAYPYHREQSEPFVGRALQDGYRDKVFLATKLPSWLINSQDDMERLFNEQLARLQTDHIDFFLLHALNAKYWKNYVDLRMFNWAESKLAEGKIRHLGFSFHDKYPVFEEILNGYDHWDFCQIQYNYLDVDEQAGQRGLEAAADKGLGVVVMEPLRGGNLAKNPAPQAVMDVFDRSGKTWTPANWSLQWIWNQPQVSLLLSGMTTMEQVEQNLTSAAQSGVHSLTEADLKVVEEVSKVYQGLAPVPCTHCEYCLPCPNGVSIPTIFQIFNQSKMFDQMERGKRWYNAEVKPENQADQCVECGHCEEMCPQNIQIIDWLKVVHKELEPNR